MFIKFFNWTFSTRASRQNPIEGSGKYNAPFIRVTRARTTRTLLLYAYSCVYTRFIFCVMSILYAISSLHTHKVKRALYRATSNYIGCADRRTPKRSQQQKHNNNTVYIRQRTTRLDYNKSYTFVRVCALKFDVYSDGIVWCAFRSKTYTWWK